MPDPAHALALAMFGGTLSVALFWPVHGFFWRTLRALRATDRVRIEDALKHLYECEYHQRAATLHSLAGILGLSGNRAAELLSRLEELGLVTTVAGGFRLTPGGRSEALRVIRFHRLWERYLSEETGLAPTEWHADADDKEHRISSREADALAARMGEPRYDPHGDPIPTAGGEIAPPQGKLLTELRAGDVAEVVHVEDEPEAVYAQLVALGLHPGLRLRLSEVSARRIRFEAGTEEHVVAPVVAANVSVVPVSYEDSEEGPYERLSELDLGEKAEVRGISALCRGLERRRLLDLGIVPGTLIEPTLDSPVGDPTAYRVRGTVIALRRQQAELIQVRRSPGQAEP